MTNYSIEGGLPIPEANKGGRPPLERLAERDEKILEAVAQGVELNEAIEAAIPKNIERGSENWYQRKSELKKRIANKINNLSK